MAYRPHYAALYRWLIIRNHLPTPAQVKKILDVGSNDNYIASQIPSCLHVAVDLKPISAVSDRVLKVNASAENIPLVDGVFDCILAFDILEHVERDRQMMHDMLRVLAPEGTIYFSTPTLRSIIVPWFIAPYANRSFGHVRNGYTPEQIQALLPNPQDWTVEWFYWNEPVFRTLFMLLYLLKPVPAVTSLLAKICYKLDRLMLDGDRGHLFGTIRRSQQR